MRQDADTLKKFYASPLGQATGRLVIRAGRCALAKCAKYVDAWDMDIRFPSWRGDVEAQGASSPPCQNNKVQRALVL